MVKLLTLAIVFVVGVAAACGNTSMTRSTTVTTDVVVVEGETVTVGEQIGSVVETTWTDTK